jgi:hypothetical protein
MEPFPEPEPLSEDELDRLQEFLEEWGHGMNIEELDGFFSALIAGPEAVMPSQYLPEVFGTDPKEGAQFEGMEEAQWVLSLMMRQMCSSSASPGIIHGDTCLFRKLEPTGRSNERSALPF